MKSIQLLDFDLHQAIGQKDHWFTLSGIQDWRGLQTLGMGWCIVSRRSSPQALEPESKVWFFLYHLFTRAACYSLSSLVLFLLIGHQITFWTMPPHFTLIIGSVNMIIRLFGSNTPLGNFANVQNQPFLQPMWFVVMNIILDLRSSTFVIPNLPHSRISGSFNMPSLYGSLLNPWMCSQSTSVISIPNM